MIKSLHTVEEVITELGGPKVVSQLTERKSASAVPMWKHRAKFPPNTYTTLQAALQDRGLTAPASLWGMKATERA